ncbi:hypothetical protein [Desulfotomaculum copahuensis]|uniref:Uncharacterized protein n=1 Tax=Desulfotomaculum copahuensis TaxID=1838280 RepID=A0A1B7LJN1_9FIRM|nr:hypothetical protein [Desulfotomaculum copahuensis]OAT86691.1 hypothetical protein A6M21_02390 [Desulfotomaculum copahuensis]
MQWHGWRIPVVLLAMLAGLGVFLGAQWLYNKYSYQEPLAGVLKQNPAVASFAVHRREPVLRVAVRLKPVNNLMDTYQGLQKSIRGVLGDKEFKLEIEDDRDSQLNEAYYYSQFAVYEAVARGNYREMADYIAAHAAKVGASARIFLDQDNIYLQMSHGRHYLYQVIPRTAKMPPAVQQS